MALSDGDREALAWRAATVYERAMAHAGAVSPAVDAPEIAARLRLWQQAFAPGDAAALERRLSWDGLDLARARAAASDTPTVAVPSGWTHWIDRILASSGTVRDAIRAGRFERSTGDGPPFEEVWAVIGAAARAELRARLDAAGERELPAAAVDALERQLRLEVSRHGELALYEWFQQTPAVSGRYAAFVEDMLGGGLTSWFLEYPALARALADLTTAWLHGTTELITRLAADRAAIAAAFGVRDLGTVTALTPGLSDPHHGRRRVASLQFQSGVAVIYKPRSVGCERAFGHLLSWVNARSDVTLPILRVVERDGYGWIERAHHAPAADATTVARIFRQTGSLLALAHVLRARDLHLENVIVTAAGPVLIDLEMLFQPPERVSSGGVTAADTTSVGVADSLLATGFVTAIEIDVDGVPYDTSGLRGDASGRGAPPGRVWSNLGRDDLGYREAPTFRPSAQHRLLLDGTVQHAGEHAAAIDAGFSSTYTLLMSHRDDVLAPDGPLSTFAACQTRVLPRPTAQYGVMLGVLALPRFQRDGATRSVAVDALHREHAASATRPRLWPIAVAERRALARLDVPYFSVAVADTMVHADGEPLVAGDFATSGLDAVRERVRSLSDRDLALQRALLRRSLAEAPSSTFASAAPAAMSPTAFALWIAQELLGRAERRSDGLFWSYQPLADGTRWSDHYLYAGSVGTAVFFAAVAATSGDAGWRQHARLAVQPLRRFLLDGATAREAAGEPIGVTTGLGSIVYGLTLIGALCEDAELVALASQVAEELARRAEHDRAFDVTHGAAGAVLSLLALHNASGNQRWLDLATAFGDRLLATARPLGDGIAWSDGSHVLTGFAHGQAGVVYALAQLAGATGAARFEDGARGGCRVLLDQYLPGRGNFGLAVSVDGRRDTRTMTAWCHGAPGIALALGAALDICGKQTILSEFEAALRTTAQVDAGTADHVCCGLLARAEVLLTVARRMERAAESSAAGALAGYVMTRARTRGQFTLSGTGIDYRVFDPGFFQGLAGIGYHLLRLEHRELPSVLAFDGPAGRVNAVR